MKTIDMHGHYVSPQALHEAEAHPGRLGIKAQKLSTGEYRVAFVGRPPLRPVRSALMDMETRFRWMDAQGIEQQIVAGWLDIAGYHLPPDVGQAWSRLQNETLAEAVQSTHGRWAGLATVPLQDPGRATEELEHAVRHLGLRGAMIASHVNGYNLDWPALEPFWRSAADLDVPIVIHPLNYEGGERFKAYNLENFLGRPLETSLAAIALIFGGVLDRNPRLKPVLVHGGGFLPYQFGRLNNGCLVDADLQALVAKPPETYLTRFHYDTVVFDPRVLTFLISLVGKERVLLGTDSPFEVGDLTPTRILESAGLDDSTREAIASTNTQRLFGLS